MAFVKCIDDLIKLVAERGAEVAVPNLVEARNSYRAPISFAQTAWVELFKASPATGED